MFSNMLHHLAMLGIGVAKSFEAIRFIDSIGYTTSNLNTSLLEEFFSLFQSGIVYQQQITMRFQINFINFQLL